MKLSKQSALEEIILLSDTLDEYYNNQVSLDKVSSVIDSFESTFNEVDNYLYHSKYQNDILPTYKCLFNAFSISDINAISFILEDLYNMILCTDE